MRSFLLSLCLVVFSAFTTYASGHDLLIDNVWARPTKGNLRTSAIYFDITNNSDKTVYITDASTNVAEMTQLHKTVTENDVARMIHIKKIAIPAGLTVKLKPGGIHIMLMNLHNSAKIGDEIPLTLTFDNGNKSEVIASVKAGYVNG